MQITINEIAELKMLAYYRYKSRVLLKQQRQCTRNEDHKTAQKLAGEIAAYNLAIQDIQRTIDSIENDVSRSILRMRYEFCLDWKTIGKEMGYCRESAIRLHRKAVDEYEDIRLHSLYNVTEA